MNDCAFTVENLLRVARHRGLPWDYLPLAAYGVTWSGRTAQAKRAMLGVAWLAKLARGTVWSDLRHVHSVTVAHHSQLVPQRYVLHAHGTDVRTLQYQDRYGPMIRRALRRAEAVCYSTPDLAEHTLRHRPDARYVPVPIHVDGVPTWNPGPPTILFSSRWDASKGLCAQLELARRLVKAFGPSVQVLGLDWGEGTSAAREAGVRLLPRRDHREFVHLLSRSSVVIGQSAGILAASELEALAVGVPLVMRAERSLYPAAPPVLDVSTGSPDAVVAAVEFALRHGPEFAARQDGPAWVRQHHAADKQVDQLVRLYAELA